MKRFLVAVFFCCVAGGLWAQANFSERSRFAVGLGGNLAFKTIGGYHGRAYFQFSPKWKMALSATDIFKYNLDTKKTTDHLSFDFNILHARKRYNDYDVFYFFEGINTELWERNYEPKMSFRKFTFLSSGDTIRMVTSLNLGMGFEKPIGPIGFYAEMRLGIGAVDWLMVTFGIKTNLKRIYKGTKRRYDLNLDEE